MVKFTKAEIKLLGPCHPWNPSYIEFYPEDEATAPEIKAYVETIDAGVLAWLMAGSVALATAMIADAGMDVNFSGSLGRRPLHFAALYCKVDVITYLRSMGADNNLTDIEGLTPKDFALATEDAGVIAAMGA